MPSIGGVVGALANVGANVATGQVGQTPTAPAVPAGGLASAAGTEGLASTAGTEGLGPAVGTEGVGATGAGTPNFGSALTEAISSLETGQANATAASQALATGTVSDPEAAVATVADAALEMQLAAQIRSKATEAAQTIFNTQV